MDASFEVRFDTLVPRPAIFGKLYSLFQEEYTGPVEDLPIQKIPEEIRNTHDDFRYQPHYRIQNNDYIIQIGPQVLSIGCINNYPGWGEYKERIISALSKLQSSGVPTQVTRIGLRYINFFGGNVDIFERLDSEVFSRNTLLTSRNSFLRTDFLDNDLMHMLQISNSGTLTKDGATMRGSMIDIDISQTIHLEGFLENTESRISHLHDAEKEIFFGLLSDEFLSTFKISHD